MRLQDIIPVPYKILYSTNLPILDHMDFQPASTPHSKCVSGSRTNFAAEASLTRQPSCVDYGVFDTVTASNGLRSSSAITSSLSYKIQDG